MRNEAIIAAANTINGSAIRLSLSDVANECRLLRARGLKRRENQWPVPSVYRGASYLTSSGVLDSFSPHLHISADHPCDGVFSTTFVCEFYPQQFCDI